MRKRHLVWLGMGMLVLAGGYWVGRVVFNAPKNIAADGALGITRPTSDGITVFDQDRGCLIAIPEAATAAEQRAAEMVQDALAKASGKTKAEFQIQKVDPEEWGNPGRLVRRSFGEGGSVGSTLYIHGANHRNSGEARLGERVTWRASPGRVEITSYPADAIEAAAAWFLRETLGARWFMPGELGEHVPVRGELRLAFGDHAYSPSYISRNLGLGGGAEEQAWWGRNRLRAWFRHGHAMNELFKPEDVRRNPELAPLVNGAKFLPTDKDGNWQPNVAASGAAEHAAGVLARRREFSSAIGLNDSIRFDQSAATRAKLGEEGWFRHRPDYSPLYFGFVNDVARRMPGRFLAAYAYDWTENTPGFPIERNVVPYLTADRSEWFDPAFAEEDKALIKRWVASGAEVVGLYDYYYGAPFLVPRPTLYAVSQSIPYAHEAGVRAFYAEVNPNWGLDGPKAWLAAELLWDAKAKPGDLLDIYYRDFWREAAGPMRAFHELCDRQWLNQPKPSYWIKYFKDEHQHRLFPGEVRRELHGLLAAAQQAATTELTRKRVAFVEGAFAVTEAFCVWEEAKERLSQLALPEKPGEEVQAAWAALEAAGKHLKAVQARVTKETPLAVKASILPEYERNDPRLRAAWRASAKREAESGKRQMDGRQTTEGGGQTLEVGGRKNIQPSTSNVQLPASSKLSGVELLQDANLAGLAIKPPVGSMDLEWVTAGPWRGHGEPWEFRHVEIQKPETGNLKPEGVEANAGSGISPSGFRFPVSGFALLMRGCKQETLSQMVPAEAGRYYLARVAMRGKVSPGNMTFLILNFQDAAGRPLGVGVVDRLPVGEYADSVELVVWAKAPKEVKSVGLGVRALNQVNDDYAAFSGFSLQALVEPAQLEVKR